MEFRREVWREGSKVVVQTGVRVDGQRWRSR